jgi:agmatine deiminase
MAFLRSTPTADGFSMPAEWTAHAGCIMQWPSRRELWDNRLHAAVADYAAVANAIAAFEPVMMVCPPGLAEEVRSHCDAAVTAVEIPINDSWARDCGPVFVRNDRGDVAVVGFGFNAWGNRWHPHDDDAAVAERIADLLDLPFYRAPFVLEGGSFFVDGEGTVLTTEQCLLNPNRNPTWSRSQIEDGLCTYLGATTVVWLPYGHSTDVGPSGTDGHIDGVAQYVGPAHVMLEVVADPASPEHDRSHRNLATLHAASDAHSRAFTVSVLDPGVHATVSYANHYLANGAVIVPVGGDDTDEAALQRLTAIYPDRDIVAVPGTVLAYGGGGPHCITQQVPVGVVLP